MKPSDDEIVDRFLNNVSWSDFIGDEEILEFFEWAYQEGKKEVIESNRKRPTKMEIATT